MTGEKGSALIYILIAIALLAALTASFMQPASQQASSQNIVKTVSEVRSQAEFIRSGIQECALSYPGGDQFTAGVVLLNNPFPINPSSSYLTSPDADDKVRNVRCPGNPGNSKNHADIFGGASGKFLPPAPDLFEDWVYYSGDNGVFFYTRTSKTDAFLVTALQKLDDEFSECEADVIDASGGAVNMLSSGTTIQCPAGNSCFRVWMIAKSSASTAYQAGSPERSVPCP